MLVPMVEIRPVRMAMYDRLVPVAVCVQERVRLARMRVVVVPIVVAARVLVLLRRVRAGRERSDRECRDDRPRGGGERRAREPDR